MNSRTEFATALRSFDGFLRGTKKAEHTLTSYHADLETFRRFLEETPSKKPLSLAKLRLADLQRYAENLRLQGLRANTRRRKLLTVRRFLRYLSRRGRVGDDPSQALAAPSRVERVPESLGWKPLMAAVRALPFAEPLQARDRLLLWTLLEGGLAVQELVLLDWGSPLFSASAPSLRIAGKRPRTIEMSSEWEKAWRETDALYQESFSKRVPRTPFCGFNRRGPLSLKMTPRGAELIVESYRGRLEAPRLTPRVLRHSAVAFWAEEGTSIGEIQKRLGLRTAYSLRVVPALWRKNERSRTK